MWLLVSCQTAKNICQWCVQAVPKTILEVWVRCPVSSLHRTSVSRKDTFFTLTATTSFPSCPTERQEAIFEDTRASRMAAVWLIIAWRKIVNKGHGMAHADLAAMSKKCLGQAVWVCCVDVVWTLPLYALMVSFMLLLDTVCFFYIYALKYIFFHCGALFPALNKS